MNTKELGREKQKAKRFWDGLDSRARGELGDAFVLGTFDWREWFDAKPSKALLEEIEYQRLLWEMSTS